MEKLNYINIEINKIKNISHLSLELPLEKGLYAIVGENGCGKSTIMLALSQLVKKSSLQKLSSVDYCDESFITLKCGDDEDIWRKNKYGMGWRVDNHLPSLEFPGFYEGSIFYGTRFTDSAKAQNKLPRLIEKGQIVDADEFVVKKLGWILHNDPSYYNNIKRIKNREIAQKYSFNGIPYFYETGKGYISQLAMSSGECMLITLLHFVNNVLIRENYKEKYNKYNKILLLIDEVELALHPKAINRLLEFMKDLTTRYELIVIFSSHSAEVIRQINANNIFYLQNEQGQVEVINPCYPSYAIRDLYSQDGFDFLLLVEDELAKRFVKKILMSSELTTSKLVHVLPTGGWINTLSLHNDIIENNVLGLGKKVISIIDGDVKEQANKKEEFKNLKKLFLPIPSIEKYLYENFVNKNNSKLIKQIGDKYFIKRSLKDILSDYKHNFNIDSDKNGKKLYGVLKNNLYEIGITEKEFIDSLCNDLLKIVDTEKFIANLRQMLS